MLALSILGILALVLTSSHALPKANATSFTYVATQSGNWDDPATWGGNGIPDACTTGYCYDNYAIPAGQSALIPAGITVTIEVGVIAEVVGYLQINGTLINNGYTSCNFGTISNSGTFTNNGAFANGPNTNDYCYYYSSNGSILNYGDFYAMTQQNYNLGFDNPGTITNHKYFDVGGYFGNEGSITNSNNGDFNVEVNGYITNYGSLTNYGTFYSAGFTLGQTGSTFYNHGSFLVDGSILELDGTSFYNYGNVAVSNYAYIDDDTPDSTTFVMECGGTITNVIGNQVFYGNISVSYPCEIFSANLGPFSTSSAITGTSDSVSVSWSQGTSPYTVTLYYTSSSSCSSSGTESAQETDVASSPVTLTFTTPSTGGTFYYCATIQGALGGPSTSNAVSLDVVPPSYSVTFQQAGIPTSGVTWGVTVGSSGSSGSDSSVTVSGLMGTLSYSYHTPIVSGRVEYVCSTGCTGSVSGSGTVSAAYTTRYLLAVASAYGTASGAGWYDAGSSATFGVSPTTVSGSSGTQYVFSGWSSSDSGGYTGSSPTQSITLNNPVTETAAWTTQYQVTYSESGCTPLSVQVPSSEWVNAGGHATGGFAPSVVSNDGLTRCILVSDSRPSSITSPTTVIGTYQLQYYLTVSSSEGTPTPASGWFNTNSLVTGSINSPVAGAAGTQYVSTGWTGSGSAPASGSTMTVTFTITSPSSIAWNWKTQYQVSFAATGLDSSATGQAVTVNANNVLVGGLPYAVWADSGGSVTFSYSAVLPTSNTGERFSLSSVSKTSPFTVSGPTTVTGIYIVQYYLTVSSLHGTPNPSSGWVNSGASVTETVASPVPGGAGIIYVVTGWTGSGSVPASGSTTSVTFTMTSASAISWNWEAQYLLTLATSPSGLTPAPTSSPTSSSGYYDAGTAVTLTANSVPGYVFLYWEVDSTPGTPQAATIAVTMDGPHSATAVYTTPSQAVQSLITTVNGMNLAHGTTNSLDAKLNAALGSINRGNNNAAANQLNAFINEVNAQTGEAITSAQAMVLTQDTQAIITTIS